MALRRHLSALYHFRPRSCRRRLAKSALNCFVLCSLLIIVLLVITTQVREEGFLRDFNDLALTRPPKNASITRFKYWKNATPNFFAPIKIFREDGRGRLLHGAEFLIQPPHKESPRNLKNSSNEPLQPRLPEGYQDVWQRANSPSDSYKLLVYSAYWDDRNGKPYVRVIGVTLTKKSPLVYCRLVYPDSVRHDVVATRKVMNEHWGLKYSSHFFSCPAPQASPPPISVSISGDKNHQTSATVPVRWNRMEPPEGNIVVCVKPLHYFYDRAVWLVEFIEMHRLLGVDHFIFYNHTVGPNVERVLRSYEKYVSVLPWELDVKSQKEIRTEGLFASLNDCLFRTMYVYKYAIMLDFDEYIVPRKHDNYSALLDEAQAKFRRTNAKAGSFVVKNAFFYLYWENDTSAYGEDPERGSHHVPYLLTQYKTRRLASTMRYGSRSKYIVVPERALEVGNHVVWRHIPGNFAVNVPDTLALLHHYRICEFGGYDCLKKPSVVDRAAVKYNQTLLSHVHHQCLTIFPSEGRCPDAPPLGSPY